MTVAAIVVTYHPQEVLLARVLEALAFQVNTIYLIDNTPTQVANTQMLERLQRQHEMSSDSSLHLHFQGQNLGIATAQNIGIQLALQDHHQELIFFDQDSAPPDDLVQTLLQARHQLELNGEQVGAIGPMVLDAKSQYCYPVIQSGQWLVKSVRYPMTHLDPIECDCLISSGCLISRTALEQVGDMLDCLFIDWVDIEWCIRARRLGLANFVIPAGIMLHSIGDDYVRIGKRSINIHSDIRHFYIIRNEVYLMLRGQFPLVWLISMAIKLPQHVIFFTIISKKSKWRVFKAFMIAIQNGVKGEMGPAPNNMFI